MTVGSGSRLTVPHNEELSPLPSAGLLLTMPGRAAIGFDEVSGKTVEIREYGGMPVFAAAAFMPPGYICTRHSAYRELTGAPRLPLYCYAAVGWKNGRFYAAGLKIDYQRRHDIADDSFPLVDRRAAAFRARFPRNRLVAHLVDNCVLRYRCPNACNLVLGKWECPIPVSRSCNAACLGCISQQPVSSCVPSTQHRLNFLPTATEIAEYAVPHLVQATNPIVSFGQGCEGEPLLSADLIEESIRAIRLRTRRGSINLNTNGSIPAGVERLCKAGLNSMRVSLNSVQKAFYSAYYRPRGYCFDDMLESIMVAKRYSAWVSLNYLIFPGFTDSPAEVAALRKLLRKTGINMIQTRNLNIDPVWYRDELGIGNMPRKSMGIEMWVYTLRHDFPNVILGYYNPTRKSMRAKLKEFHRNPSAGLRNQNAKRKSFIVVNDADN